MRDKRKIHLKNEKGFTLVEILISIAILSFGLLAVAAMQNAALLGTGKSKSVTEATTVGMDRMERIFAIPFDDLKALGPGSYNDDDLETYIDVPALPDNVEFVTWKILDPASLDSNSAKIIEVRVKSKQMRTQIVMQDIKIKLQE